MNKAELLSFLFVIGLAVFGLGSTFLIAYYYTFKYDKYAKQRKKKKRSVQRSAGGKQRGIRRGSRRADA